jgi:monoamine oxidase
MNLKEYLSRLPWHAKLLKMYIVNLETDTEELDKMSAYFAIVRLKYAIDKGEIYGENNFFIKGGYQSLINILQKGQNVFYRSEVELIDYSGEKVKIKTSNTEFEADYVISTVPINVLRNLKFKPQLPESKINIMNHIGVFDVLKVNVIFNEKIGVSEETLNMQADKFINWWQTYDGISHVNQDGWVLWITGPKAREFRTKPESEIIDFINHELSQFVQKPFKILHIDIKDWNKENFIQGAYSNLKPGAPSNTIELMRENVGDRIFFAGEACEIDSSTVHGAYLSGKRVAEELLANENKML